MRRASRFLVLPFLSILGLTSCGGPPDALTPSLASGPSACNVTFTYIGSKVLTVQPNSTNDAGWFINNDGSAAVTISGETLTKSGNVTAVRSSNWAPFPATLGPGSRVDADVFFDVGAAGGGTVGMSISTNCGTKTSPAHSVSILATPQGIPYGATALFNSPSSKNTIGTQSFNLSLEGVTHSTIIAWINAARATHVKLLTSMTGGAHSLANHGPFLKTINGTLQFDMNAWRDTMALYGTRAIKDSVAHAVADGIIIGNSVMDEPNVTGGGDGNTWGPSGTMTKARVDSMCTYVKGIFPTLPVGVAHGHAVFDSTSSYQVCEFIVDQYAARFGDVTTYRDGGLALAARDHHAIAFSINILNGGVQDKDGTWDCIGTGGLGQRSPNCAMTSSQVRNWGQLLGQAGCAMVMWRYDPTFMSNAANQSAFADVAALLATKPSKPCRRS